MPTEKEFRVPRLAHRPGRMKLVPLLLAAGFVAAAQTPAEVLIEAGHWKRARAIVEARLAEAPADPLAIYLTSQIRFAFGHQEAPLELAKKAVALAPGVAKFHRQLAEALGVKAQRSNLFQQAFLARRFKKEIETALSLDPNDIQAQRDLMEYYLLAPSVIGGDKKQAQAVAAQIGRIDHAQGLIAEARIAAFEHDLVREEAMLRKAVAVAPAEYKVLIALAQFYAKERIDWDAAAASAREAVKVDGARVDGYSILAAAYAAEGRWTDLDRLLSESDHAVPDDWAPHFRAAEAMIAAGKNPRVARADLLQYLGQEPEGNEPSLAEARQKLKAVSGKD